MWSKIGKRFATALAFFVLLTVAVGVVSVVFLSKIESERDRIPVTQSFTPDITESTGNWEFSYTQIGEDIEKNTFTRFEVINACNSVQTVSYECTAETKGEVEYSLSFSVGLEAGKSELFQGAISIEPEVKAQLSQTSGHSTTRTFDVPLGTVRTIQITQANVYRTGYGILDNNLGTVLEGTFTYFTGGCSLNVIDISITTCQSASSPSSNESNPPPVVVEPTNQPALPDTNEPLPDVTLSNNETMSTNGNLVICTGDIKVDGVTLYDSNTSTGLITVVSPGVNRTVLAPFGAFCDKKSDGESFAITTYISRLQRNGCSGGCSEIYIKTFNADGTITENYTAN